MDLVSFTLKNSLNIKNRALPTLFFKYFTKENFQIYIQTTKTFQQRQKNALRVNYWSVTQTIVTTRLVGLSLEL
jgi:hypothetical protein